MGVVAGVVVLTVGAGVVVLTVGAGVVFVALGFGAGALAGSPGTGTLGTEETLAAAGMNPAAPRWVTVRGPVTAAVVVFERETANASVKATRPARSPPVSRDHEILMGTSPAGGARGRDKDRGGSGPGVASG